MDLIHTEEIELPLRLIAPTFKQAQKVLNEMEDWSTILKCDPIDNRVLWTFEEGIVRIVYQRFGPARATT